MQIVADRAEAPTAIQTDLRAIFVSLELSRSTWLITSLSPGGGEKMSKHSVQAGDIAGLLKRFAQLKEKARARTGRDFPIITIQEAGLDGFWIHRVLRSEGIESHVVDPASIATSRRRRRAKTDKIDGETLVRTLLAYKRGEPRVCAMVKVPTPEEEDGRRLCRERKVLIAERVLHVNRIKGLLFCQGISGYEPLRRDRQERLEELQTGDGRLLPQHLKVQVNRELNRLDLLLKQIKAVEAERDALLVAAHTPATVPASMLLNIRGIGPEFAAVLWSEGLFRHFDNRRQVAAYAGLAPTPWQSGAVDREQGVSKAGNPRLRTTLIQLAWLWLRNQPHSALTLWFHERVIISQKTGEAVPVEGFLPLREFFLGEHVSLAGFAPAKCPGTNRDHHRGLSLSAPVCHTGWESATRHLPLRNHHRSNGGWLIKYSTNFMVKWDFVNHQIEIKVKVRCDADCRESSIVQGFDVEKVAQLYGATEIVRLRSGNFLFREGDEGDALYIVKSGTLRIMSGGIVYESVRAGGIVGEMALVDRGMPRSASVIAATSAELIKIDVPKFLALIASAPDFALTVMGVIARRIRVMNSRYRPNPSS